VEKIVLHHTSIAQAAMEERVAAEQRASALATDLEEARATFRAEVEATREWWSSRVRLLTLALVLLVVIAGLAALAGWLVGRG
jgi:hypothetical protein